MRTPLSSFLFEQPDAQWRLGAVRWSLAGAVALTVATLPPGEFFAEHADTVGRVTPPGPVRPLSAAEYDRLRVATLVALGAWGATGSRAAGTTAALSYARLSQHVAGFFPDRWNYNSHLSLFLLAAGAVDSSAAFSLRGTARRRPASRAEQRLQSLVLAFMQSSVGLLYFQSATSKLRFGGLEWLSTGRTVRGSIALMGTPLARRLGLSDRACQILGNTSFAVEAMFLPLLILGWPDRRILALAATGFHLGAWATLGISFWHLWVLYPALFLLPAPAQRQELLAQWGHRLRMA